MTEGVAEAAFRKSTAREYFESLVITVILALFGTTFIVQAFKIPTPSMEKNLLVGDHLLVNKFAYGARGSIVDPVLPLRDIQRGDIIVFKYPRDLTKHYVKRTIGLPGDRIRVEEAQVFINGQPLTEPYKQMVEGAYRVTFPPLAGDRTYNLDGISWYPEFLKGNEVIVPPNQYFAMGDNRDNSQDSRYWGFVKRELIVGKALVIYWSYESDSDAYRRTDVRDRLHQVFDLVTNFFRKTRWSRTLRIIR
jgi:signal peptidase I